MTYPEAIERLRGHRNWWWYDYHGSEREPDEAVRLRVQREAIELALTLAAPGVGVKPPTPSGRVVWHPSTIRVSYGEYLTPIPGCGGCGGAPLPS